MTAGMYEVVRPGRRHPWWRFCWSEADAIQKAGADLEMFPQVRRVPDAEVCEGDDSMMGDGLREVLERAYLNGRGIAEGTPVHAWLAGRLEQTAGMRNAPPAESRAGRCHQFCVSDPCVAGPTVSISEGDSGVRRASV